MQQSNSEKKIKKKDYGFFKSAGEGEDSAWLTTYADMMTLLLTFLVFLLSISTPDPAKYKEMMRRLGDALGAGKGIFEAVEEETLESIMLKLRTYINSENLSNDIILTQDSRGIVLYARDNIFFKSGETVFMDDAKIFFNNMSKILKNVSYKIIIEGHTDDVPIQSDKFPSNWELSANRAGSVVRYLISTGNISPSRLVPAGYADIKPRFPPTPENREKNRRIEIVILREKF